MKSSYGFYHCESSKNGESSDSDTFGNAAEAGFEAPSTKTSPVCTFSSVSSLESTWFRKVGVRELQVKIANR